MRNLALLVRKDFLSAVAAYGNLILIAGIFVVIVAVNAPLVFVMLIYIMVINLFASEENDLVCNVAGILPIRRSQTVIARYLYTWLLMAMAFAVGCVVSFLATPITGNRNWLPAILFALASALVMVSVIMPLNYRFGVAKTRIISMAVYIVMVVIASALTPLLSGLASASTLLGGAFLSVAGGLLLSLLSMAVSIRVVQR